MMKKCLRCNKEMIEGLDVKVEGGAYGLKVAECGIFKDNLGKLHCAVCPECGYTEMYIDDTDKIKKVVLKNDIHNKKVINWVIAIVIACVYLGFSILFDAWAYSWLIWAGYAIYRFII